MTVRLPLPSRSRMFPTSATQHLAELGYTRARRGERERTGARGRQQADRRLPRGEIADPVSVACCHTQRGAPMARLLIAASASALLLGLAGRALALEQPLARLVGLALQLVLQLLLLLLEHLGVGRR